MVAGVGNGQDSQSTSGASNLVQKNCVMSLNIIGAKARMTRTAMTGLMKGRIQARILRHPPQPPAGWLASVLDVVCLVRGWEKNKT